MDIAHVREDVRTQSFAEPVSGTLYSNSIHELLLAFKAADQILDFSRYPDVQQHIRKLRIPEVIRRNDGFLHLSPGTGPHGYVCLRLSGLFNKTGIGADRKEKRRRLRETISNTLGGLQVSSVTRAWCTSRVLENHRKAFGLESVPVRGDTRMMGTLSNTYDSRGNLAYLSRWGPGTRTE